MPHDPFYYKKLSHNLTPNAGLALVGHLKLSKHGNIEWIEQTTSALSTIIRAKVKFFR